MTGELSSYETDRIPVDGGYRLEDLRGIARRVDISGRAAMTKHELIHALNTRLRQTDADEY